MTMLFGLYAHLLNVYADAGYQGLSPPYPQVTSGSERPSTWCRSRLFGHRLRVWLYSGRLNLFGTMRSGFRITHIALVRLRRS